MDFPIVVVAVGVILEDVSDVIFVVVFDLESVKWDTCTFESPFYVFLFLLQQLSVGRNSPGPVCKSVEFTVPGR